MRTDRTSVKFSSDVIKRKGRIGEAVIMHFRRADWDLILFSDECQFNLSHADRRERIYHLRGEGFADACVIERDLFGGGSVLVWGGIIYSIMLTAYAAVSKRALSKMVDT